MTENQVIVFVGLVAGLVMFLLIRQCVHLLTVWWRRRSEKQIAAIDAALLDVDRELDVAGRFLLDYHPGDPEPYGPAAAHIRQCVDELGYDYEQVSGKRSRLLNIAHAPCPYAFLAIYGYWLEAHTWYQINGNCTSLLGEMQPLLQNSQHLDASVEGVLSLPGQTIARVRALRQRIENAFAHIRSLQAYGVHGTTIDELLQAFTDFASRLRESPKWLE